MGSSGGGLLRFHPEAHTLQFAQQTVIESGILIKLG